MHILITDLYTFLMELVRRICLNIKTSYHQWSLPLFLSLEHSNKQWSCKEKFHFHQGLELRFTARLITKSSNRTCLCMSLRWVCHICLSLFLLQVLILAPLECPAVNVSLILFFLCWAHSKGQFSCCNFNLQLLHATFVAHAACIMQKSWTTLII